MVLTINPIVTISAGADDVICSDLTFATLGVFGGGASTILWTTSGTGTFLDDTDPTTVYTPSAADIAATTVRLKITSDDPAGPCLSIADSMVLTINPVVIISAGANDVICSGSTYTLSGVLGGGASSSTWSTSGTGTFDNVAILAPIYTPSAADIAGLGVTLTLTSNDPAGPCLSLFDAMTLTIDPAATATAGVDATICAGSAYVMPGAIGGSSVSSLYTTSGDGTFADDTDPLTIYTPGVGDIGTGSVTITITSNDPAGPCPAAVDAMILTISTDATTSAGNDTTICSDLPVTLSGVMGGGATVITWTSTGAGSFDNAALLAATYTPFPGDTEDTLIITTDDPDGAGPCLPALDSMFLTINPVATVDAGVDVTICSGSTHATAGVVGGGASSSLWTTSGTGTFLDDTDPTTTYTPSAADIIALSVTLKLTTDNPAGPCLSIADSMVLTINPIATVSSGGADVICSGSSYLLAGVMGGGASSVTWTTSGDGSFDNPALLAATYTPGAADIAGLGVTLTITTDDPVGPCLSVNDAMILTINSIATTTAGPDATICAGGSHSEQ